MTSTSDTATLVAIGQRIRSLRGDLKQVDFAEQIGVASKTVIRWESGQAIPDGDSLLALHVRFGADPGWVLTGNGSPPPLSAREAQMLNCYRIAGDTGRDAIDSMASALARAAPSESTPKKTMSFHAKVGQVIDGDAVIHNYAGRGKRRAKDQG